MIMICPAGVNIENVFFTAEILLFINNLFDSLNGFGHSNGQFKRSLSSNSIHLEFWNDAVKKLDLMKFDSLNNHEARPLCLKHFVHNIVSIKYLWVDLQKLGAKFLSLRRLNQDPLENFFGQIRGQGGFNSHPDCHQFVSSFKTLLINNITTGKSLYTNCASDDDNMLGTLSNLVRREGGQNIPPEAHYNILHELCTTIAIPQENVLQSQAVSYIAGAICRYLVPKLGISDCESCNNVLLSNDTESFHCLINLREYSTETQNLTYPSKRLSTLVWECIYVIEKIISNVCNVYIYPQLLSSLEENVDLSWLTCTTHKTIFTQSFFLYVIRMQVRQWCINFNRRMHNVDSRPKSREMENLINTKVTKGLSYRSVRLQSS